MSCTQDNESAGLAPRGAAYLIDYAVAFLLFASTQILLIAPLRGIFGLADEWFASGLNMEIYVLVTISLPIWLYFALCEASPWQATIGKHVLKLKVEDAVDGSRISVGRSFVRTVVKLLPWEFAHVTNNFPEPMWYSDNPGFRIGFVFVGVLMGIYVLMVVFERRHRAPHDWFAHSVVVKHTSHPISLG